MSAWAIMITHRRNVEEKSSADFPANYREQIQNKIYALCLAYLHVWFRERKKNTLFMPCVSPATFDCLINRLLLTFL